MSMNPPAKSYYRVMLGRQSAHVAECLAGGFIGTDFEIHQDLSGQLPGDGGSSTPLSSRCSWPTAPTRAASRQAWPAARCGQ